jgi:hypothetical protein
MSAESPRFCRHCGQRAASDAVFCSGCGARLQAAGAPPPPVGQAAGNPPSRSTAVFVLGLLSLVALGPLGIIGWCLSVKGTREIKEGRASRFPLFTAGKVMSIIGTVATAVFVIVVAVVFGLKQFGAQRQAQMRSVEQTQATPPAQVQDLVQPATSQPAKRTCRLSIHANTESIFRVRVSVNDKAVFDTFELPGKFKVFAGTHFDREIELQDVVSVRCGSYMSPPPSEPPSFDLVTVQIDGIDVPVRTPGPGFWEATFTPSTYLR